MGDSAMVFQVRWWIESYRIRAGCLTRCTWPCRTPSTMPGMTRPFPTQTLNLQTNSEMADLISHKFGGQKQKSAGTGLGWRRAGNLYHLSISGGRLNTWYCAFRLAEGYWCQRLACPLGELSRQNRRPVRQHEGFLSFASNLISERTHAESAPAPDGPPDESPVQ